MNPRSFNFTFKRKTPAWEVDFRDASIVAHAQMSSIKTYTFISLCALLAILTCISLFTEFDYRRQNTKLNTLQTFLSKNTIVHKKMMQYNKEFLELHNTVQAILNAYTLPSNLINFLAELCKTKPQYIKFNTITATYLKSSKSKPLNIQLYGVINNDVALLESYKKQLTQFQSLSPFKDQHKCFYNFDKNTTTSVDQKTNNTVFQLTFQHNV